ncbi:MAG TPA: hypothetical protein VIC86_03615 [Acidimicrobiales bacterium]
MRLNLRTGVVRPSGRPARAIGGRWVVGGALGAILVVAAACGSSGASPSTSTGAGGSTTGRSATAAVTAVQRGSLGVILIDKSGKTLYRFSPDGTGKPTCSGACAAVWPPLTVPAGTMHVPASGVGASDLGTVAGPGGALQVTFKGMPLYRFSGDTKSGDAKGQGLGGTWFVVPAAASSSATPSTTTSSQVPASTTTAPPGAQPANRNSTAPNSPPATPPPATPPPATPPPATAPPATAPPMTVPPVPAPPAPSPPTTQGGGYGY